MNKIFFTSLVFLPFMCNAMDTPELNGEPNFQLFSRDAYIFAKREWDGIKFSDIRSVEQMVTYRGSCYKKDPDLTIGYIGHLSNGDKITINMFRVFAEEVEDEWLKDCIFNNYWCHLVCHLHTIGPDGKDLTRPLDGDYFYEILQALYKKQRENLVGVKAFFEEQQAAKAKAFDAFLEEDKAAKVAFAAAQK